MAITQDSGGGAITPGAAALLQQYGSVLGGAAAQPEDPYDRWERHFQRTQQYRALGPSGLEGAAARPMGPNKRVAEERDILTRDRKRLAELARKIGVELEVPGALGKLWLDAVDEARAASLVEPGADPWKVLEAWARTGSYSGAAGGAKSRSGTFTQKQKQVNLTDPETAKAVILAALRQTLQRDPTEKEIAQFSAALRAEEQRNPTTSTTTSTYDEEGNLVSSDTTTEGGAPAPGDFAEMFLRDEFDAEADGVRAGQEYFDVARQLASAVV